MMNYCYRYSDIHDQTSESESKYENFHSRILTQKRYLHNGGYFASAAVGLPESKYLNALLSNIPRSIFFKIWIGTDWKNNIT